MALQPWRRFEVWFSGQFEVPALKNSGTGTIFSQFAKCYLRMLLLKNTRWLDQSRRQPQFHPREPCMLGLSLERSQPPCSSGEGWSRRSFMWSLHRIRQAWLNKSEGWPPVTWWRNCPSPQHNSFCTVGAASCKSRHGWWLSFASLSYTELGRVRCRHVVECTTSRRWCSWKVDSRWWGSGGYGLNKKDYMWILRT